MPLPKRSSAPPRRLWVLLSSANFPVAVYLTQDSAAADLGPDETVYRYNLSETNRRGTT